MFLKLYIYVVLITIKICGTHYLFFKKKKNLM